MSVSKQPAFLAAFVGTASVTKAAKAAKIERTLHYRWLEEDAAYRSAFEKAKEQAAQLLEDEAVRRAHDGIEEPVTYQGEFTYPVIKIIDVTDPETGKVKKVELRSKKPLVIKRYSDGLLQFLLRGFRLEKYGAKTAVELSGPNGGPIALQNEALQKLSDDELASLIALAHKLTPEP